MSCRMGLSEECYNFFFHCCRDQTIDQDQGVVLPPRKEPQDKMAADGEDPVPEEPPQPSVMDEDAEEISDFSGSRDGGFPDHLGSRKQLHSGNGHNLAISPEGQVYGTRELYHPEAIMEFISDAPGLVKIKGEVAQMFVAMNYRGKVYAEEDPNSENTVWMERYENGYNNYVWKQAYPEMEFFLGLKKSGKPKRGDRTLLGQRAVRFLPRPPNP